MSTTCWVLIGVGVLSVLGGFANTLFKHWLEGKKAAEASDHPTGLTKRLREARAYWRSSRNTMVVQIATVVLVIAVLVMSIAFREPVDARFVVLTAINIVTAYHAGRNARWQHKLMFTTSKEIQELEAEAEREVTARAFSSQ